MVNDTIADVLTRIRNAGNARHRVTKIPSSYMAGELLRLLKQEGYIDTFSKGPIPESKFEEYSVHLKFDSNGAPIIKEIRRYSKPGRRVHAQTTALPKVKNGLGIALVSTSKGLMTDKQARIEGVGGEILATVF